MKHSSSFTIHGIYWRHNTVDIANKGKRVQWAAAAATDYPRRGGALLLARGYELPARDRNPSCPLPCRGAPCV